MRPATSMPVSQSEIVVERPTAEPVPMVDAEVIAESGGEGNGHYASYPEAAVDGEVVPEYAPAYERPRQSDETRPQSPAGST